MVNTLWKKNYRDRWKAGTIWKMLLLATARVGCYPVPQLLRSIFRCFTRELAWMTKPWHHATRFAPRLSRCSFSLQLLHGTWFSHILTHRSTVGPDHTAITGPEEVLRPSPWNAGVQKILNHCGIVTTNSGKIRARRGSICQSERSPK